MSKPVRHHYIPQFYLKGFCREGEKTLWLYDKVTKNLRAQNPSKIAVINNYYTFESINDKKDTSIENEILSTIEKTRVM
jgi:hypothetical protein